jgi:TatD DNase family protein
MYFDTHAHYDDEKFDNDRDALLSSMKAGGVDLIVDPASDIASAIKAKEIAAKYPFVYFAAGVHPSEVESAGDGFIEEVRELLHHPKNVAVGEIGLDYHYGSDTKEDQKRILRLQMELARQEHKPVIIHEREACADTMEILRDFKDVLGVVHCFSGSWETAKEILNMGWSISFTGVVTFKNARKALEVVEKMPIDRLMLETDSPYMAPEPHRGQRCSSLLLPFIGRKVAEIRGISEEEVAYITKENGKKFFSISENQEVGT